MNSVFILIVFLPLVGSLIAGLFGTAAFRRSIDGTPEGHDATSAHQPVAGHEEGHGGGDTAPNRHSRNI